MHVDGRALIRRAVARCVAEFDDFAMVAQAATGAEALAGLATNPQIVLLNPSAAGPTPEVLIRELAGRAPGVAVLLFCEAMSPWDLGLCREQGVRGCLADDCTCSELLTALQRTAAGEMYWSEQTTRCLALSDRLGQMTESEWDATGPVAARSGPDTARPTADSNSPLPVS